MEETTNKTVKVTKKKWLLKMKDSGASVIGISESGETLMAEKGIAKEDVQYVQDVSMESQLGVVGKVYFVNRSQALPMAFGIGSRRYAQLKKTAELIREKVSTGAPTFVGVIKEERCKEIQDHLTLAYIMGVLDEQEKHQ